MKILISLVASTATFLSRCESKKHDSQEDADAAMASARLPRAMLAPVEIQRELKGEARPLLMVEQSSLRGGSISGSAQRGLLSPLGL